MNSFYRVYRPCDDVFIKAEYSDDGRLSISGVEGPRANGYCQGSCGQINMSFDINAVKEYAPGWTRTMLKGLLQIWEEWHLNDMQAGSPAQQAELKKHEYPGYPVSHYDWACGILENAGLQPDPNYLHNGFGRPVAKSSPKTPGVPYSYGYAWLKKEVPEYVLETLKNYPEADKEPAWV
jgi:hypothetical protein